VQPTGENGATRAPIVVDLQREPGLSSKSIMLQIDSKSQQVSASKMALHPVSTDVFWDLGTRLSIELDYFLTLTFFSLWCAGALRHSLQDRLSKGASGGSGRGRADEIYLKLRTSTGLFATLTMSSLIILASL
jgi:dynamin 1/3